MTEDKVRVCTIILGFGSENDLADCIASINKQEGIKNSIILIQNGARKAFLSQLRAYPEIEVIFNGNNIGAAAGRNSKLGIKASPKI